MVGDLDQESNNRAERSRNALSYWEILLILINKIEERCCDSVDDIPILDVYSSDPWQLPEIGARDGEPQPQLYFCCTQEEGVEEAYNCREGRPSGTTPSGHWKAQSTPSYILLDGSNRFPSGMKNTLVFYHGHEPSSAAKTMWLMNEYVAFQRASDGAVLLPLTPTREMSICQVYNTEATTIPADAERSRTAAGCVPVPAAQLLPALGDDGHGHGAAKQCEIPQEDSKKTAENKVEITQMVVPRENAAKKQQDYSWKRVEKTSNGRRELRRRPDEDDGYSWRKYGQNKVMGCKYPRSYYRCGLKSKIPGGRCGATKTVQQVESTDGVTRQYQVAYYREHICVPPPKTPPIAGNLTASASYRRASEADDVEVQQDDGSDCDDW